MSKFCSHCGKELLDEAIICPGCGCKAESHNESAGTDDRPTKKAKFYLILSGISVVLSLLCAIIANLINSNTYTGNAVAYMSESRKSMHYLMINIQTTAAYMFILFLLLAVVFLIVGIIKTNRKGD